MHKIFEKLRENFVEDSAALYPLVLEVLHYEVRV